MNGRQRTRRRATGTRRPIWLLGALATTIVLAIGLLLAARGGTRAAASVGCSAMEQVSYHQHLRLVLVVEGQPVPVPANIGFRRDCIAWLHTHDASGVLHVEAPAPTTYTLGAFFAEWGQPLDATHLLDRVADGQHAIRAWVNGQPVDGPPESIPLMPGATIVVEYGPPFAPPAAASAPPLGNVETGPRSRHAG